MGKVNSVRLNLCNVLIGGLMLGFLSSSVLAVDALYVDPTGNVGVGTSAPTRKLNVEGVSDAYVLVKNTSGVASEKAMFTLANKGKTRFIIQNATNVWSFDNDGNKFQISKVGTGIAEFQVFDNGDGTFVGDVYANEFLLSSARDTKTDFETVDSSTILERLDQLEITSWRYKEDEVNERHIGPVAEDFQEVFNLGNGTHISAVDTSGIAFAAIKGLRDEARQQAAQMESLQAENERLLATNADLEKRLRNLEKLIIPSDLVSNN